MSYVINIKHQTRKLSKEEISQCVEASKDEDIPF